MTSKTKKITGSILGLIVGDALGVPVEGKSRDVLDEKPVEDFMEFGVHNMPLGTWSDDSSMTLCLLEVLVKEYNLKDVADSFVAWVYKNKWTPHGKTFGMGSTTSMAIGMLNRGFSPENSGSKEEASNGNGSLMRILPLLWYIIDKDLDTRYQIIKEISGITHSHIRSVHSCFYYLEFARYLYKGFSTEKAFEFTNQNIITKAIQENIRIEELSNFARFFMGDFDKIPRGEIESSGYVVHTLEASIWCLVTTTSYKEAVLKAVNLGGDTDTTAAVTGGLAGILYGLEGIPENWVNSIVRLEDIKLLIDQFCEKYNKTQAVLEKTNPCPN
jgi:ADP-ribosylglycohydrolase